MEKPELTLQEKNAVRLIGGIKRAEGLEEETKEKAIRGIYVALLDNLIARNREVRSIDSAMTWARTREGSAFWNTIDTYVGTIR